MLGKALRDVVLTRDEALGLMDGLLWTEGAPAGRTRFSEWLEGNGSRLGLEYANELPVTTEGVRALRRAGVLETAPAGWLCVGPGYAGPLESIPVICGRRKSQLWNETGYSMLVLW